MNVAAGHSSSSIREAYRACERTWRDSSGSDQCTRGRGGLRGLASFSSHADSSLLAVVCRRISRWFNLVLSLLAVNLPPEEQYLPPPTTATRSDYTNNSTAGGGSNNCCGGGGGASQLYEASTEYTFYLSDYTSQLSRDEVCTRACVGKVGQTSTCRPAVDAFDFVFCIGVFFCIFARFVPRFHSPSNFLTFVDADIPVRTCSSGAV